MILKRVAGMLSHDFSRLRHQIYNHSKHGRLKRTLTLEVCNNLQIAIFLYARVSPEHEQTLDRSRLFRSRSKRSTTTATAEEGQFECEILCPKSVSSSYVSRGGGLSGG